MLGSHRHVSVRSGLQPGPRSSTGAGLCRHCRQIPPTTGWKCLGKKVPESSPEQKLNLLCNGVV